MTPFPPFRTVSWKVLGIFLDQPMPRRSFSDLVRISAAGPTNVKKALETLCREGLLSLQREGNKTLYRLELQNVLVRSLIAVRGWQRVSRFPPQIQNCLAVLIKKLAGHDTLTIYLFGSSLSSLKPNDIDVGVVYQTKRETLQRIWTETVRDFEENVEAHFIQHDDFIAAFREGDYTLTSTLWPCLPLYDRHFLLDYLGNIPPPSKKIILQKRQGLESRIARAYQLYRQQKPAAEDIVNDIWSDFLRLFIASKQQIPGPKQNLSHQAKLLKLQFKKRTLWETLEWMSNTLRQIRTII